MWPFGNKKPKFKVEIKHDITECFSVGGKRYFQFSDVYKTPSLRALKALSYYDEFIMRCTRPYLQAHYEAVRKILREPTGGVLQLTKLDELNEHLGTRLKYVVEVEQLWKWASVVFFDESENPYDFDMEYSVRKIKHWKKHEDVRLFFSKQSMQTLIPYLQQQIDYSQDFEIQIQRLAQANLELLLESGLNDRTKQDLMNASGWLMEMQRKLNSLANSPTLSTAPQNNEKSVTSKNWKEKLKMQKK